NPGPDTLVVDPGAYLIAENGHGAVLANTGAWTVTVNGSIVGTFTGIFLDPGNSAVSTIKISASGEVQGNVGLFVASSANINNAGDISGGSFAIAIESGGAHTITNSGTMVGVVNSIVDESTASNDTVRNSGTITGGIFLANGNDTVTNSGALNGDLSLGDGNDT